MNEFRFHHMQQSTACLHFAWRTVSLRVGGRAARRSCLPGLRRGGGRQAGATVLSCLVWRCELSRPDRQTSTFSVGVCRAAQALPVRPPDALRRRIHLSGGRADSVHTATPDTTRRFCLCRVWCTGVNQLLSLGAYDRQAADG